MKIVVDTNIIFSALLRETSLITEILLRGANAFVMPKYADIALFKYKDKILTFSRHSENRRGGYHRMRSNTPRSPGTARLRHLH